MTEEELREQIAQEIEAVLKLEEDYFKEGKLEMKLREKVIFNMCADIARGKNGY